ncbi:MAG: OmpH family outer membrane protein [Planctomycetota bacterium]|nr:MAG: OmpH family outer membrane protein [Planctomycetota bacterium]
MRRNPLPPLLSILALGLAVLAGSALAQDPPKRPARGPRPLKVGVVDIGVLFKGYKRKDELEKIINERREQMKEEIQKERERVRDLRERLDKGGLRENSEPYLRAVTDIKLAQYQLELKQERLQASLKKLVEQHTLQILSELESTIEAYGRKYGYDLILKIDKAQRAGAGGESDLVQHFQERIFRAQISDVLYFNERALNITRNVETLLNSPANLRKMERQAKEKAK